MTEARLTEALKEAGFREEDEFGLHLPRSPAHRDAWFHPILLDPVRQPLEVAVTVQWVSSQCSAIHPAPLRSRSFSSVAMSPSITPMISPISKGRLFLFFLAKVDLSTKAEGKNLDVGCTIMTHACIAEHALPQLSLNDQLGVA